MDAEEFRRFGHEVIDWIADYLANVRDYRILPRMEPGDLVKKLPASGPEQGEPMEAILRDFQELILPAATHWNHPRFCGYFAITGSAEGVLAEALTAALNQNGMLWQSSPAGTELEQVTLDWLRQWLGLKPGWFGLILDTASVGAIHALAAAREAADPGARAGKPPLPLTVYTSEQAHSSIEKAAITAGIAQTHVRKVPVDPEFQMIPEELERAIERDAADGLRPFFVAATAGTTSVASVDPLGPIGEIAARYGLWLHVDAAYGGSAAVAEEFRFVLDGVERAHSLVVSPQKWLFTPMDCSVFYTRRPEVLRRAFTLSPEYLRTDEDTRAVNFMDYCLPLGRRFRALKLWFLMRRLGRKGVAELIRNHVSWAKWLAGQMKEDGRFEIVAPVRLSLVCFRYRGSDEENRRLFKTVNDSGEAFLSHNVLGGRFVIRCAIGNAKTTKEDVETVWRLIREAAEKLSAAG